MENSKFLFTSWYRSRQALFPWGMTSSPYINVLGLPTYLDVLSWGHCCSQQGIWIEITDRWCDWLCFYSMICYILIKRPIFVLFGLWWLKAPSHWTMGPPTRNSIHLAVISSYVQNLVINFLWFTWWSWSRSWPSACQLSLTFHAPCFTPLDVVPTEIGMVCHYLE